MDAADAANVQKQNLNVPACAVAVATVNVIRPRMAAILDFVSVNWIYITHNSMLWDEKQKEYSNASENSYVVAAILKCAAILDFKESIDSPW